MSARRFCRPLLLLVVCPLAIFAQAPTIRDSAGVRIVESPAVANTPIRFRLADKPDIVIGGLRDNPDDELDARFGYPFALHLAGNRLLVADGGHFGVFDASGKLVARLGRAGAGPGEFRTGQSGCRFRGDSLLLWDGGNRRVSIWGPDGKLVREYIPTGFAFGESCLSDGTILVAGTRMPSSHEDIPMATNAVVATNGDVRGTTDAFPSTFYSGSVYRQTEVGGYGNRFFLGDQVELGVRVLDHLGKLVEVWRTKDAAEVVTDANLKAHPMVCVRMGSPTADCVPRPTKIRTWPAFYALLVGDDGRLWFRLSGLWVHDSASNTLWVGFDSTGRVIGRLIVSQGSKRAMKRIVHFGRGEVLLSDYDEDGGRRMSVYKIVVVH